MGFNSGSAQNRGDIINSGTITFMGGSGDASGILLNGGTVTNHNTITFSPGTGLDSGKLIGTIIEDPIPCFPVGGELIPIDKTALLLAGAQSFSWMIPVLISIAGIGLFFLRKK